MKAKPYIIAAVAGASIYFAGQAFWNRRTLLERGGGGDGFADKGLWSQLWEATPNLIRTATVGTVGGLAAYYAARRLG